MPERLRRTVAAAVLAGFGLALAPPLALAFETEEGGCCRRGRCCCPGVPTDGGPCVRAACRCGEERTAVVAVPSLDEALLPAPVTFGRDDDSGRLAAALRSLLPAPDLVPPDHPPPFSHSIR